MTLGLHGHDGGVQKIRRAPHEAEGLFHPEFRCGAPCRKVLARAWDLEGSANFAARVSAGCDEYITMSAFELEIVQVRRGLDRRAQMRMLRDILDPFAIQPDFAAIPQALDEGLAIAHAGLPVRSGPRACREAQAALFLAGLPRDLARDGRSGNAAMNSNSPMDDVVLVDESDRETGRAGKLEAHRQGQLHRAISVLVHDGENRQLLQKRQHGKYHSQGQWSNACCSHPRPGEAPEAAAHRRLQEEMGFDCPLDFLFTTIYRRDVGNGLIEHELVHVFAGQYRGAVAPDPEEADGYQWLDFDAMCADIERAPEAYSAWLRIYLETHAREIRAACTG